MSFPLLPSSEIEKLKLNELIIKDTALQVIKDFASFGMEVKFPADLEYAYDSLFNQLKIIIAALVRSEPEKLSALLYQIDIDERKLRGNLPVISEDELLCRLILEREFLKVVTRYYFKNYEL
jgi:hypothetical protein